MILYPFLLLFNNPKIIYMPFFKDHLSIDVNPNEPNENNAIALIKESDGLKSESTNDDMIKENNKEKIHNIPKNLLEE
tara:strand:- start:2254 stop:2487 length:234 start_codon:yes stop_codon:yes gene_type:complete